MGRKFSVFLHQYCLIFEVLSPSQRKQQTGTKFVTFVRKVSVRNSKTLIASTGRMWELSVTLKRSLNVCSMPVCSCGNLSWEGLDSLSTNQSPSPCRGIPKFKNNEIAAALRAIWNNQWQVTTTILNRLKKTNKLTTPVLLTEVWESPHIP